MICRDGMTALPQHFSFRLARTEDDFRSVFGLRYQVYCRELGWERAVDCLGGFERDAFDGRAQHALLIHHASGEVAACVRVRAWSRSPPSSWTNSRSILIMSSGSRCT